MINGNSHYATTDSIVAGCNITEQKNLKFVCSLFILRFKRKGEHNVCFRGSTNTLTSLSLAFMSYLKWVAITQLTPFRVNCEVLHAAKLSDFEKKPPHTENREKRVTVANFVKWQQETCRYKY